MQIECRVLAFCLNIELIKFHFSSVIIRAVLRHTHTHTQQTQREQSLLCVYKYAPPPQRPISSSITIWYYDIRYVTLVWSSVYEACAANQFMMCADMLEQACT